MLRTPFFVLFIVCFGTLVSAHSPEDRIWNAGQRYASNLGEIAACDRTDQSARVARIVDAIVDWKYSGQNKLVLFFSTERAEFRDRLANELFAQYSQKEQSDCTDLLTDEFRRLATDEYESQFIDRMKELFPKAFK